MDKREFLKFCGASFCMLSVTSLFGVPRNFRAQMAKKGLIKTKLSPYFTSLEGGEIQCELCPHRCRVAKGKRGICRVRENRDGKYYSLVYGNPCAVHLDPMRKNLSPMSSRHNFFFTGHSRLQFPVQILPELEISQAFPEDIFSFEVSPELMVSRAKEIGAARLLTPMWNQPSFMNTCQISVSLLKRQAFSM